MKDVTKSAAEQGLQRDLLCHPSACCVKLQKEQRQKLLSPAAPPQPSDPWGSGTEVCPLSVKKALHSAHSGARRHAGTAGDTSSTEMGLSEACVQDVCGPEPCGVETRLRARRGGYQALSLPGQRKGNVCLGACHMSGCVSCKTPSG